MAADSPAAPPPMTITGTWADGTGVLPSILARSRRLTAAPAAPPPAPRAIPIQGERRASPAWRDRYGSAVWAVVRPTRPACASPRATPSRADADPQTAPPAGQPARRGW